MRWFDFRNGGVEIIGGGDVGLGSVDYVTAWWSH